MKDILERELKPNHILYENLRGGHVMCQLVWGEPKAGRLIINKRADTPFVVMYSEKDEVVFHLPIDSIERVIYLVNWCRQSTITKVEE